VEAFGEREMKFRVNKARGAPRENAEALESYCCGRKENNCSGMGSSVPKSSEQLRERRFLKK